MLGAGEARARPVELASLTAIRPCAGSKSMLQSAALLAVSTPCIVVWTWVPRS